jgi:hypothetical protein
MYSYIYVYTSIFLFKSTAPKFIQPNKLCDNCDPPFLFLGLLETFRCVSSSLSFSSPFNGHVILKKYRRPPLIRLSYDDNSDDDDDDDDDTYNSDDEDADNDDH